MDALTALVLKIFRVNGQLLAAGDALTKPFGQSSSRWQVLGALHEKELTVSEIAREMGLARQSVQRTVDLLVREKTCELADNPKHARSPLVKLSKNGVKLLEKLSSTQTKWVRKLGKNFREKDVENALSVLDALSRELN